MSNTLKTYFVSRKRDFSNKKKNDGDERKKAKEIILDYH